MEARIEARIEALLANNNNNNNDAHAQMLAGMEARIMEALEALLANNNNNNDANANANANAIIASPATDDDEIQAFENIFGLQVPVFRQFLFQGDSRNEDYDADNEDYDADADTDNDADNAVTNTIIDDFWKMKVKELQSESRKREISYSGLRK